MNPELQQHMLQMQADEKQRLKVKLTYLGIGAVVGAALFMNRFSRSRRHHPTATLLTGAVVGEGAAWLLHGFMERRWFI